MLKTFSNWRKNALSCPSDRAVLACGVLLGSCNTDVVNPGGSKTLRSMKGADKPRS